LASFPPLVHPSGTTATAASATPNAHGYGSQTFTQYSRETILTAIAAHDATHIQRPAFDNSDAPILLTTPQLDLEVNKPLPVGAKFEPLATDKRTRSLSKKSDAAPAPPQPTAAQIVAAAAAKAQQTTTVKVVTAKPATAAPAKAQPKKEDGAAPAHKSNHSKKPAVAAAAPTQASAATKPAPTAPAVLSWADRARAPPTPAEPKKKSVDAPAKPTPETTLPAAATAPVLDTPTVAPTESSDAIEAVEAK
jgi:hypothetical protein